MSSLTSARRRFIALTARPKPTGGSFSTPRVAIAALIGALLVVAAAVLLGVA